MEKLAKGDCVIIKEMHRISQEKFNSTWPQGVFGKIIEVVQKYDTDTGKKLPIHYIVRVKINGERSHLKTYAKYLKL